jgi:hypothetical protein
VKKLSILIFTIFLFFLVVNSIQAYNYGFEKGYSEIGYKEVNIALQESNDHFKRDIALPTQLPPVTFTHNFGRFNNLEGNANDEFEITYINKDLTQNHYQIRVKPVKYKLEFREEQIDQTIKLKDESEAIYSTQNPLDLLAFEKDGWQYILLIDKRISDKVTKEALVEIANSIK